jgi:hypothetical protein
MRMPVALLVALWGCASPPRLAEPIPPGPFAHSLSQLCLLDGSMPGCKGLVPVSVPQGWRVILPRYLDSRFAICRGRQSPTCCVVDAVEILFDTETPVADRQEAVDAVGVLEGGAPATSAYYVRIPSDGTRNPLNQAISQLRRLPQVVVARQKCVGGVSIEGASASEPGAAPDAPRR